MKTMIRRNTIHLLVLLVLALSVAVVATSVAPSTAQARTRLQDTTPLMGDPDVTDAPGTGPVKSAALVRQSSYSSQPTLDAPNVIHMRYFVAAFLSSLRLFLRT